MLPNIKFTKGCCQGAPTLSQEWRTGRPLQPMCMFYIPLSFNGGKWNVSEEWKTIDEIEIANIINQTKQFYDRRSITS